MEPHRTTTNHPSARRRGRAGAAGTGRGIREGGSETILLLEDDSALHDLEREGAGHQVLAAAQPEEALAAVCDSPDRIDW